MEKDGLCQIQNDNVINLRTTEKDHKQRNTQQTGLLRAEQHWKIVVWIFLPAASERPQSRAKHKGKEQRHDSDRLQIDLCCQNRVENNTGEGNVQYKLLDTLYALRRDQILFAGKHTEENRGKDWRDDQCNTKYLFHIIASG